MRSLYKGGHQPKFGEGIPQGRNAIVSEHRQGETRVVTGTRKKQEHAS